jgi:ADP-ribose pyrophosphatase
MEKEIFKGKIVRLTLQPKKINKKNIEFEKVYLFSSVHIFVVTPSGKIRLVREKRWDRGGKIKDKVVAGILEKNEKPLQTAKRELKEELGLIASKWEQFLIAEQKGVVNDKRIYYLASDLHKVSNQQEDGEKIVGHVDYSIKILFEKMLDGYFGTSPTAVAITQLYYKVKKGEISLK